MNPLAADRQPRHTASVPVAAAAEARAGSEAAAFPYLRRMLNNAGALAVAEGAVLLFALVLGAFIRLLWKGEPMFSSWMWYLVIAWLVGSVTTRLLPGWGLGPVEELRRTVLLLVAVFAGTTAMLFWGKAAGATSRFVLTTGFIFSVFLIPIVRTQVKRLCISRGAWGVPAVIYGDAASTTRVIEALREEQGLGYVPAGVFSDSIHAEALTPYGLSLLGKISESTLQAPVAVLTAPNLPRERMTELLEGPLSIYRKVVIIPDLAEAPSLWVKPRDLMGMLGLEISSNLLDPFARAIKRSADLAIVLATAPVWAPLTFALGFLVWSQDGHNALFLQERVGKGGRVFRTWKFRTMRPDAEKYLEQRLAEDTELREEWRNNFKLRADPRITPIGAFLRQSSLDELPQLVNVLKGDMSLVGPRPLPLYHYEQLPERARKLRDRVRPGITGLWQVSGRSNAGHAAMPKWDTYYVRNWSIWLDIVILVRTVRTVLTRHGAI